MEEVQKKFDEIVKLELVISNIYGYLFSYNLVSDRINMENFVKMLEYILPIEKNLFSSLTNEEIMELVSFIEDNSDYISSSIPKGNLNSFVLKRILNRLKECLLLSSDLENSSSLNGGNIQGKIECILSSELIDTIFSFLDEYIENEKNSKLRENLMKNKYAIMFSLSSKDEDRMIGRNLFTEKSLYLSSSLELAILRLSYSEIKREKNKFATAILNSDLSKIQFSLNRYSKKEYLDSDIINTFIRIRSTLLFYDEIMFNSFIQSILDDRESNYILDKMFDADFVKTVKNDRNRHKMIVLGLQ